MLVTYTKIVSNKNHIIALSTPYLIEDIPVYSLPKYIVFFNLSATKISETPIKKMPIRKI